MPTRCSSPAITMRTVAGSAPQSSPANGSSAKAETSRSSSRPIRTQTGMMCSLVERQGCAAMDNDIRAAMAGAGDDAELYLADARPPEFSDEALALEFSGRHADELRFVADWGRWLTWTGRHWQ